MSEAKTTTRLYLGFMAKNGVDLIPIVITNAKTTINLQEIETLAESIIDSQCLVDENKEPAFLADYCYIVHNDIKLNEY